MLFWLLVVILVSLNGITEGAALTRSTRPGICPMFEPPPECPEELEHFCLSDDGCPTGLKCCKKGCDELDCVVPDLEGNKTNISPTVPVTAALTRSTRPVCPLFEPPPQCPEEVHNYCSSDDGCSTGLKCCNTGCELDCVVPEDLPEEIKTNILPAVPETALKTRSPRPGKCPVFQPPPECPEEVKHFCSSDDGCPTGLKCCKKGCDELDCVVPDLEGNKTNILPTVPVTALTRSTPLTGRCPVFEPPLECPEEVKLFCLSDDNCPTGLKCCNTGCDLDCVVPDDSPTVPETAALKTRSPRPGKCPVFQPPPECPEEVKHFCSSDDGCPAGLKCCKKGCDELDCVVPDFKGIKTNISPTVSQTVISLTKNPTPSTNLKGIKTKYPTKAPKTGDIRLANGFRREEGRVEIFHNGEWGTVCDDWWDIQAANVACRHLGFFGARRAIRKAYFGPGSVPILLDNVRCRGDESSLGDCSHNGWGKHNCGHYEDASVVCETREFGPPHPGKCPDFPPPAECPSVKKDLCSADDYCPTGQKCCYTGCQLDCVGSE